MFSVLPEDVSEFRCRTKVVYRIGALEEIPMEFEELGAKKIVIITDKGVRGAGIVDQALDAIGDELDVVGIFDEVEQDAKATIIEKAKRFVLENEAEGILAIGGGSVMDTVKSVNVLITAGEDDIREFVGVEIVHAPMMPHIAVPTTSGTGCEVTWGAVVLDEEEHTKIAFMEWYSVADVAILDPIVAKSMPPKITASTGIDALTHAIEGYTSIVSDPFSDSLCYYAIRLISKWLREATQNGDNLEARGFMMYAASIAGIGFWNGMTGAVHATAHALGGTYGIPHGVANSIMLPAIMEYNIDYCTEKYKDIALAMGINVFEMSDEDAAREAIGAVRKLISDIGLPSDLKQWNIPDDDIPMLVEKAIVDSQMNFNPRPAEEDEVAEIYRSLI